MRGALLSLSAILMAVLLPLPALADVPVVICSGLPGCEPGLRNVLFDFTLPGLVRLLIIIVGGTSVLFTVWGGAQMLLIYGDEGKAAKGKTTVLYSLLGLGVSIVSGTVVTFVATERYNDAGPDVLVGAVQSVIRITTLLFNVGFVIVVILAGVRMVIGGGKSDEFGKGTAMIKWAVIGAAIVNGSRALVEAFLGINF